MEKAKKEAESEGKKKDGGISDYIKPMDKIGRAHV